MKVYRAIISDYYGTKTVELGVFASRDAARVAIRFFGSPYEKDHTENHIHEEIVWEDGSSFIVAKRAADEAAHVADMARVAEEKALKAKQDAEEKARKAFEAGKRAAFEKELAAQWAAQQK